MEQSDFWAKTYPDGTLGIDVIGHCRNAAWVAFELAERFGGTLKDLGITPATVAFLAGSHDCGKISLPFQGMSPVWLKEHGIRSAGIRVAKSHSVFTRDALIRFICQKNMTDLESAILWATAVGAHHGRVHQPPTSVPKAEPQGREGIDWEYWRRDLLEQLAESFAVYDLPKVDDEAACLWHVGGIVSLADWIASDEKFFPVERAVPDEVARKLAQQAIDALQIAPLSVLPDQRFENVFGFAPNEFQKQAMDLVKGPGLYILEAPMGMGKTEAALWASWRLMSDGSAAGIYFALPTQVTSNRIWLRMRDFADQVCPGALRPRIVHSGAWLEKERCIDASSSSTDEKDDAAERWFCTSKRALFAPLGAGTADQALMSVLAVKHFFMRRFALAGKVVILDEVHSYDAYTGELVIRLCRELVRLGSTVIILSATLTEKARSRLLGAAAEETPSVSPIRLTAKPNGASTACVELGAGHDKPVQISWAAEEELTGKMEDLALEGACVLWICDTVESSQRICRSFSERGRVPSENIGLLHSRFPKYQRALNEDLWLERLGKSSPKRSGCILVATQVVEQSVDIDADVLVTELAPTDMLLQRMGRLHRHDRGNCKWPAQCWIISEKMTVEESMTMSPAGIRNAMGAKCWVYRPDVLLRTLRVWEKREVIRLPSDMRALLEQTYDDDADLPVPWQKLADECDGQDCADRFLARQRSNIWDMTMSDPEDIQTFSTRLSRYETDEVVLYTAAADGELILLDGSRVRSDKVKPSWDEKRALAENTVRISAHALRKCEQLPLFHGRYHAVIATSDPDAGGKALQYSPKLGVITPHPDKEA